MSYLGIDLGTSGLRALLVDEGDCQSDPRKARMGFPILRQVGRSKTQLIGSLHLIVRLVS